MQDRKQQTFTVNNSPQNNGKQVRNLFLTPSKQGSLIIFLNNDLKLAEIHGFQAIYDYYQ